MTTENKSPRVTDSRFPLLLRESAASLGIAALCTLAGYQLHPPLTETDIIMLYLVGALAAAVKLGRAPALLYSLLSVSAFNYFFTEPYFTFRVNNPSWWLTFAVMFGACLVISTLAARLKEQVGLARRRAQEAKELYDLLVASTREKEAQAAAAEEARVMAEREKARSLLLSSISHDLRSPLAAITGAADTLLQTEPDNRLLGSIRQEAVRLARIVGNLLDITRIEGGQIKLNMRAYDPAEIIGSAAEACRRVLKDQKLSLHVGALPFVRMDGMLMNQVIQNLLENAARHTPPGTEVDVTAEITESGGLRLTVEDNGPGIPAGQEKDMFNKFATYGRGDRPKGTGLGLAICQAILQAHRGTIRGENRPGGGCRIVAELPRELTLPLREAVDAG